MKKPKKYDVCLSFAGEDRRYVKKLHDLLVSHGVRVFYDEYEKAELWGKDLYSHLDDVYQNTARYCVVFLSKHYAKKLWTNHERKSAQARAFREHAEYILPVRFDDTKIEGIRDTVGFINLRKTSSKELCELIIKKLGPREQRNYLPPMPDRLFKAMKAKSAKQRSAVHFAAMSFFEAISRMNRTERAVVLEIFRIGCPTELPDNVHVDLNLLKAHIAHESVTKILRVIADLKSLGIYSSTRKGHTDKDEDPILAVEWHDMRVYGDGNGTMVANEMVRLATDHYCEACGTTRLKNLDFGQLASATVVKIYTLHKTG